MPIEIYTGKPGSGKTAFLVDRLLDARAHNEKHPEQARTLVAAGINGLVPGIADIILDEPAKWSEIIDREQGPCTCPLIGGVPPFQPHTHRIPVGSLIFVDEAWKWFGHLQDARSMATPKHVLDLAEHRHMGVDFVWTTQGPNQLFPFVRPLIADHTHHVRRFGTQFVDTFKWEELQEDTKSSAKREAALKAVKVIPKRTFGLYKSAEQHTIKRNIPWRVVAVPGMFVLAVLLLWLAYVKLRPSAFGKSSMKEPASALAEAGSGELSGSYPAKKPRLTNAEYAEQHLPRFASMPWTAPVFDDRPAISDPLLLCMSSQAGVDGQGEHQPASCTCLTEQGTSYDLSDGECRAIARRGTPYNPYRERRDQQSGGAGFTAQIGRAHV